ncbi:MAG TPA: alpha-amylase/4-alpha-glucanotransferase domain-containing protein [Candidatus Dormibacteraeota bacterium]|nr:alpha-amylase/4-alpha-glucanotransferase domain-containing protein [Candidatus Dormibacteraeota bacterium]
MTSAITVQQQTVSLAIVHHANQYMVTNGYENRVGISEIIGTPKSKTGLLPVLNLHQKYKVPLNLHISGTLLEAIAWHNPEFLDSVKELAHQGLLEIIGGVYGQNMMRFFSHEHNIRQLNEELRVYQKLLDWDPRRIKTFWPTERLWETETMAPLLTSSTLLNGRYKNVILDDRLLLSAAGDPSPRRTYDYDLSWDPSNFLMHRIRNGLGLRMLPIAFGLRRNIPPRTPSDFEKTRAQIEWLLDLSSNYRSQLIGVYADDMEKVAGIGWDTRGPLQFEAMLKWISEKHFIRTVRLSDWADIRPPMPERQIDTGAYTELVNDFGAGENFEAWYYDPRWKIYRNYYDWSEQRVRELDSQGADTALIELAWKILLATSWQTAWHTPRNGAHGENESDEGPSAWTRAITSHCRIAAIVAQAAYWMRHKDNQAHALAEDLDCDGYDEIVVMNDRLFAVFSPANGGRLVYLFTVSNSPGRMVVGNPIDDWNLLEDLHAYMDVPPNHPGALTDVGFEHDCYSTSIDMAKGDIAKVSFSNVEKNSSGVGIRKDITLKQGGDELLVGYTIPERLTKFSTESGFSPDYQQLLERGSSGLKELILNPDIRGWSNRDVAIEAGIDSGYALWDTPRREKFGHGYMLRITGYRSFRIWIKGSEC